MQFFSWFLIKIIELPTKHHSKALIFISKIAMDRLPPGLAGIIL